MKKTIFALVLLGGVFTANAACKYNYVDGECKSNGDVYCSAEPDSTCPPKPVVQQFQ